MIVNYGYQDGSGTYIISVDTEKCTGCGECAEACPNKVLEIVPDEFDPFESGMVASVVNSQKNNLKYSCAVCKAADSKNEPPCIQACPEVALSHSW